MKLDTNMNTIFNVELNEFEKLFKKKLLTFYDTNRQLEFCCGQQETINKINNSSWLKSNVLNGLKNKIDEQDLLFSIEGHPRNNVNGFLVFFSDHLLFHILKTPLFKKDFYDYVDNTQYVKIPYLNLFHFSKIIFEKWGNVESQVHSLETFNKTNEWYTSYRHKSSKPLKIGGIKKGFQIEGGHYPFKFFDEQESTPTTYENWGTTTIKCGLSFDKIIFSSKSLLWNGNENFIQLDSNDLSNIRYRSNVFNWFERSIQEVNEEVCNNILLKLEEIKKTKEKELNLKKKSVFSEIDNDENGLVDVIEGFDEIDLLLKKHQEKIISIDSKHVMEFVQVSNYLKLKKKNIQKIFEELKKVSDEKHLKIYLEVLKDNIHVYDLITLNSLLMINSLINMDMITFSDIYLKFDSLNIFDSKHEKDILNKLDNLENGLNDLMGMIRKVGDEICDEIYSLSNITEESNRQLTNQLSEIDSTLNVGNLIGVINTYQNYKINRKLSS